MIQLEKLSWDNAFSYGINNKINLNNNKLIQLIGKNGHGKSSIPLILEEVLYNKNSKGIKRGDILNRFSSSKTYSIQLDFTKDSDSYKIITTRGTSTQTVKLLKNNIDISAHTATGTYNLIEEIIGIDHKAFTQIVYQSSAYSLEFLTATDSTRKKFLIDLLNLSQYTQILDILKIENKKVADNYETVSLKVKTISDWLLKLKKEDLVKRELVEVPDPPVEESTLLSQKKENLKNIDNINKKILQNNKYKELLDSIVYNPTIQRPSNIDDIRVEYSTLKKEKTAIDNILAGVKVIKSTCDMCGQPIDNSHKIYMAEEAKNKAPAVIARLDALNKSISEYEKSVVEYESNKSANAEWEKYYSLYDKTLDKVTLDKAILLEEIAELESTIESISNKIKTAQKINNEATLHNTRVDVLLGQEASMLEDLKVFSEELSVIQSKLSNLQILLKTFSPTGLIAYKIECLVKDLEDIVNEYLLDMSDGRFQLSFKVSSSDKLNVIINDNGKDVDILALSNGERARVNVSTLLAIRKLLQSLSNTRINLLVLDETVESLDVEGKEKLIEVLLKEDYLNTILISHSFTHPLVEKLHIIKENNISRIVE